MAVVLYSARALEDLDRVIAFHGGAGESAAVDVVGLITSAVTVLERHPLIGRPVEHGLRELVISLGKTGYVALYRYHPRRRAVWLLRLRHQREAGYPDD